MNIGETTTTISFNDATLRDVTVEINLNNGRLEVTFTTSDPDSQALLQNNMAALQSALQAGSSTSSVSVSVTGDSETEDSSDSMGGVGEEGASKSEKSGSESDKKVSRQGGSSAS
jgi:flagellar hook-length control protein FliK